MAKILELFARHASQATFFVLGQVAQEKPEIPRMIRDAGHEVASHGFDHALVYRQKPEEFDQDLTRSKALIEGLTGLRIRGFRAPSWSITRDTPWVYDVLEQRGFEYDASVFPFKTFLYGISGAPRFPHYPTVNGRTSKILEIPASTVRVSGKAIPFCGGFYLRLLPYAAIRAAIKRVNGEGHPAVIYFHPWEMDATEKRLALPLKERLIQYSRLGSVWPKLEALLGEFEFSSIGVSLDSGDFSRFRT
jgi:polysaccharide deacetylase family protein (PEP-CTERM system associated)